MTNGTLLSEIEEFLAKSGYSAASFGYQAADNGRLVERLRAGASVRPATEARVRAWMAENADRKPNRGLRHKVPKQKRRKP